MQRDEIEVKVEDGDIDTAAAEAEERAALAEVKAEKAAHIAELMRTREQKERLVEQARARETLT